MKHPKWREVFTKYERFVEDKGFVIVLATCVLVIVASMFFTLRSREDDVITHTEVDHAASSDQAETLSEAQRVIVNATQAPSPTSKPIVFVRPVDGAITVAFSADQPVWHEAAQCWRVHTGVDIACEYGALVKATADGVVEALDMDDWNGYVLRISHEDGYASVYAGMAEAPYCKVGDRVGAGQTIGHAGNEIVEESGQGAHLHWELYQNGKPVDPVNLILWVDKNNTM